MAVKNKITNSDNLRSVSTEDIKVRVEDAQLKIKKLKFNHTITPVENPLMIRHTRRDIAIMQTELRRRELGF